MTAKSCISRQNIKPGLFKPCAQTVTDCSTISCSFLPRCPNHTGVGQLAKSLVLFFFLREIYGAVGED